MTDLERRDFIDIAPFDASEHVQKEIKPLMDELGKKCAELGCPMLIAVCVSHDKVKGSSVTVGLAKSRTVSGGLGLPPCICMGYAAVAGRVDVKNKKGDVDESKAEA